MSARKRKRVAVVIDWARVERAMVRSVRTGDSSESDLFMAAYEADPERYMKLHARVKGEAVEEMRSWDKR